jgi:hypothetical protein
LLLKVITIFCFFSLSIYLNFDIPEKIVSCNFDEYFADFNLNFFDHIWKLSGAFALGYSCVEFIFYFIDYKYKMGRYEIIGCFE